jgi:4'-phosphopantetheinyl transferase
MSCITVNCKISSAIKWQNGHLHDQAGACVYRVNVSAHLPALNEYKTLLSSDEVIRSGNYHFIRDHDRFVISRAVLRLLLASLTDLTPGTIIFDKDAGMKPFIANQLSKSLHFNVAHSGDWILIAVAPEPVGVDVEFADPGFDYDDIMDYSFNEDEIIVVNESENPVTTFFLFWSRKEALLKGTGKGLGNDLTQISCLEGKNQIESSLINSGADWFVHSFQVAPRYIGNIACQNAREIGFISLGIGSV